MCSLYIDNFILVHTVKLMPIIKVQISGKLVTNGLSDATIATVHSEKTRIKKMIMIIIISMNKLQESLILAGARY